MRLAGFAIYCKFCLTLSFCLVSFTAAAQKKDFGIWYETSAEFPVGKKAETVISAEARTFDNASKLEEAFLEAEISYKFNDYLAAAASYRISENIEDDDAYHIRHKWFIHIKGTIPLRRLDISGRIIFQQRYKTWFEDENDKLPTSHARFRVKARYNIPAFPVDPYLSGELFCPLFKDSERVIDKKRAGGGVDIKITSRHELQTGIIFQRDYFPDLTDESILILGYTYTF